MNQDTKMHETLFASTEGRMLGVGLALTGLMLLAFGIGWHLYPDHILPYAIMTGLITEGNTPDIVFNGGDQMAMGVEMAIADAGLQAGSIDIIGGGAGDYGVEAVEDGRWYATFVTLPYDAGFLATKMAIRAAQGKYISDTGINPVERRGLPYMLTQDNLDDFGCFYPQWPG